MQYLKTYEVHYEEINEGIKNWLATFLVMANLGLAPLSVSAGSKEDKKEFVESQPQGKVDAALFMDFINKNGVPSNGLASAWSKFTSSNPDIKSKLGDVQKYIQQDGKKYVFDNQYTHHDFHDVDIQTHMPDNYLNDWGGFIDDDKESGINNLIDQYEKKTSVEICVITVESIGDEPIEYYASDRFNPGNGNKNHDGSVGIGIGKKWSDNGVLLVIAKKERKFRIQTGYGIESLLTDYQAKRILDEVMTPHFKRGEYYDGIYDAIKEIEDEIGQENIELKKQWQKDKAMHDKIIFQEHLDTALNYLGGALIIGMIVGSIALIKRRIRLKKEAVEAEKRRIEKLHRDVDNTIGLIEKIKTSLPENAGAQSKKLIEIFDNAKEIVKKSNVPQVPDNEKYTDQNHKHLEEMYLLLNNAISSFNTSSQTIKKGLGNIKSVSAIKSETYKEIETAVKNAEKIKSLGFDPGQVPSKEEVDKLDTFVSSMTSLVATDVDAAIKSFQEYSGKMSDISQKGGVVATRLSSIEGAIDRIKDWESEFSKNLRPFNSVANSSEKSKVETMKAGFESKLNSTKNWIALSAELDKVLNYMSSIVKKYEEEARKKREEEEEERRRKRRQEEDEESARRSSYSSSSSSSSSSSFGGFGGGGSGGGGASGGW